MDENNMNGFGNEDEEDYEGTTVLTTPGVYAFSNAQGENNDNMNNPGQFQQPSQQNQPEQQNQFGGFGQFQQPEQQNQFGGFGQFQQPGQQNQSEQQNQFGGFGQFQQPGQQNQFGGFGQFQQPGQQNQPEQQNQFGGFGQFQQPGQQNQPEQQNQFGGFGQYQQPGQYAQPGSQFGTPQGGDMKPGKQLNKKLFVIIGAAVLAVIIIVVVLILVLSGGKGSGGVDKIGDNLAAAYEKGDSDAMVELMNKNYYDVYNASMGENYVEDLFDRDVKDMEDTVGDVESIKITDRMEDDRYDKEDLDEANASLSALGVDMEVDECVDMEMSIEIKGSEDDAEGEITYTAVKSDGKWYLVDHDLYVY